MSFYVGWGEPNSAIYSQVSLIIHDFPGHLNWLVGPEFNDRGAFVSVWPLAQAKKAWAGENVQPISLEQLNEELADFGRFAKDALKVTTPLSINEQDTLLSAEPFEDSIYRVFLIAHPAAFDQAPTSASDRVLHFGINDDEWLSISRMANDHQLPMASSTVSSFLSGLWQRYDVVRVSAQDTGVPAQQLASLEDGTHDPNLKDALGKLRRILGEAEASRLGVVLEPVE